jgi:hypothetical protein
MATAVEQTQRPADRPSGLMDRLDNYRLPFFLAPTIGAILLVGAVYFTSLSITWFWFAAALLVPALVLAVVLFDGLKRL